MKVINQDIYSIVFDRWIVCKDLQSSVLPFYLGKKGNLLSLVNLACCGVTYSADMLRVQLRLRG